MGVSVRGMSFTSEVYQQFPDAPTVCVFGAGLGGLLAALRLRDRCPDMHVVVVEKSIPESNTQLSGMRVRLGIPHQRHDPIAEIRTLLARRNNGVVTDPMQRFAEVLVAEIAHWHGVPGFVPHKDLPEWFGPQWGAANRAGYGRGRSVLDWLRRAAARAGVEFLPAVLRRLEVTGDRVTSALVMLPGGVPAVLEATTYVIASGSATGLLFSSTNKKIHWSGHEVAFDSGIPLNGSTLHMIHPFGNSDAHGTSRVGCLETDLLAESTVRVTGMEGATFVDEHTTDLLARHAAHDHFPELTRRLSGYRQPLRLAHPDGRVTYARVAQHYHHLGIRTVDGLRLIGLRNAYAVGDAAGIGYWTNFHERQPGFALSKCLVDAALLAGAIGASTSASPGRLRAPRAGDLHKLDAFAARGATITRLAPLNTRHLFSLLRAPDVTGRLRAARTWADELRELMNRHGPSGLGLISLAMADAHVMAVSGAATEPIDIDRDTAIMSLYRLSTPRPRVDSCATLKVAAGKWRGR